MRRLKRKSWFILAVLFSVDLAFGAGLVALGAVAFGEDAPKPTPYVAKVNGLVDSHECWTSTPPADMRGKIPGHVVVTLPDGRPVYGGDALVSRALEQQFNGVPHGLKIHGFCR